MLSGRSGDRDSYKSVCYDFNYAFAAIFPALMTAVDKNAVINTRHQKGLTEYSHGVARSPSALAVLAGFRALQQLPLSRCQRRPASAVPGRSSPRWLPKLPSKPGLGTKPRQPVCRRGCAGGGPGAALALEAEWLCGGSGSRCPPRLQRGSCVREHTVPPGGGAICTWQCHGTVGNTQTGLTGGGEEPVGAILSTAPRAGPPPALPQRQGRGELHFHGTKLHFLPAAVRFSKSLQRHFSVPPELPFTSARGRAQ